MIAPGDLELVAAEAGLDGATIYLRALERTDATVALDAGRSIYPASMIKTPLAVAAASALAGGRLDGGRPIVVADANMTVNDAPSPMAPGYLTTVEELVNLMLSRSDNVATNVLFDVLGRERASADVVALGLPGTAFRRKLSGSLPLIDDPAATGRNTHPAREAAELFTMLARGAVPGAGRILDALADQYWNAKLSAGLEPGDRFAHKTGDTDEVSHDGGILEIAGERFVIVVYTERASNDATDARFAAFMRALRPHLCAR